MSVLAPGLTAEENPQPPVAVITFRKIDRCCMTANVILADVIALMALVPSKSDSYQQKEAMCTCR